MKPFLLHVSSFRRRLFLCLAVVIGLSETNAQTTVIPSGAQLNGVQLQKTNNWIRYNTSTSGLPTFIETKMYLLPKRGSGIKTVEFRLKGGDGGKASFDDGITKRAGNGGQGSTLQFVLPVGNFSYGRGIWATFGKKANSQTSAYPVAAGGGGSTAIGWVVYDKHLVNVYTVDPGDVYPNILGVAAGGGGGFADLTTNTNGEGGDHYSNSNLPYNEFTDNGVFCSGPITTYSSSSMWFSSIVLNPADCWYRTMPFSSRRTQCIFYSNLVDQLTLGETGGWPSFKQAGVCNPGSTCTVSYPSTYLGYGGVGFTGGGAAAVTYGEFPLFQTIGAGGGGTGDVNVFGRTGGAGHLNGWGGKSNLPFAGILNAGGNTGSPSDGWWEYRTIADDIAPVAIAKNITVYLNSVSNTVSVTPQMVNNGSSDNDSIASYSISKSTFNCSNLGANTVTLTVTDFAGNTHSTTCTVTVADNTAPNYTNPGAITIDIGNGPVALTQANFTGLVSDGCGGVVTYSFPPRTFTCPDAGQTITIPLTLTDPSNNQAVFNQQFKIVNTNSTIIYVDANASGANNGTTWANAFTKLQNALATVCGAETIYIATGTYKPDDGTGITPGNRAASFVIKDAVHIFGGFPSGGSTFANRNIAAYPVVLSGNIGNTLLNTDNSQHIITALNLNAGIELDGLTIDAGNTTGAADINGGGILFSNASAATSGNLIITNCNITNCQAGNNGGALAQLAGATVGGNLFIKGTRFISNVAGAKGGAIYGNGAAASKTIFKITNCIFKGNSVSGSGNSGSAMAYLNCSVDLTNCSISGNTSPTGAVSVFDNSTTTWANTVSWHNANSVTPTTSRELSLSSSTSGIRYSNLQNAFPSGVWNTNYGNNSGNNLDSDPGFLFGSSDLDIPGTSPNRNKGQNSAIALPYDITGNNRIFQDTVDIGAYEVRPMIYVSASAPGGGDGKSWATAYNNLHTAISEACNSPWEKDIWIKEGTYKPSLYNGSAPADPRFATFQPCNSRLLGGFAGTEKEAAERDISKHPTILSGDIGTANDNTDNTYHVLYPTGVAMQLDGLIIQGGNANQASSFSFKYGGGMLLDNQGNFRIRNTVFRNNASSSGGGALANISTVFGITVDIEQCLFYGNSTSGNGGAIMNQKGGGNVVPLQVNISQTTIQGNNASFGGGGIFNLVVGGAGGSVNTPIYNSIIWGNSSLYDAGVSNGGGSTSPFSSTTVQGLTGDPLFINTSDIDGPDNQIMTLDDGLRLQGSSPAINGGTIGLVPAGITKDVTGTNRILQGIPDQGPYEQIGCTGVNNKLYVDSSLAASGDGKTWGTAFKTLSDAFFYARGCSIIDSILVAKGTYYPTGLSAGTSRDSAFVNQSPSLTVLGGYPAGGGLRDRTANPTIIDGAIGDGFSATDNSYHLFVNASGQLIIDGFMMRNAYANGAGNASLGGISVPRAGGAVLFSNTGKIQLRNNTIMQNTANFGGAVRCEAGARFYATGNVFVQNRSLTGGGGAINHYLYGGGTDTIINNIFVLNKDISPGNSVAGALAMVNGNHFVVNNTFYADSSATTGGAVYMDGTGNYSLYNNVFYKNKSATGSDVHNIGNGAVYTEANNSFGTDPIFVNEASLAGDDGLWGTADDGLKLRNISQAMNNGDNSKLPAGIATDITGAARINQTTVDKGAYEGTSICGVYNRLYVNQVAAAGGDGTTWSNAFTSINAALSFANYCGTVTEIWVSKGTYYPSATDRNASFNLKNGLAIYGGFAGGETLLTQRNTSLNATILSGAGVSGNAKHVVYGNGLNNSSVLDGFYIEDGFADNISDNIGGGIRLVNSSSFIRNCIIRNNRTKFASSTDYGGGIGLIGSSPVIENCAFINNNKDNASANPDAGGLYAGSGTVTLRNCVFSGNKGGVYNSQSTINIYGCSFFNNQNSAIYNFLGTTSISTSILNNNGISTAGANTTNANYSILPVGTIVSGANNFHTDPVFANPADIDGPDNVFGTADDGLRLTSCSPAINRGSNDLVSIGTTDIAGQARVVNSTPDAGAYEFQSLADGDELALGGDDTTHLIYNGTNVLMGNFCRVMGRLLPNGGGTAVAGNVRAITRVDATVQAYNGVPYVQRHFDIEPAINAATSTARLTLFFSQSEFNLYNDTTTEKLPTGPADAAGKARLRIKQYHGTSATGEPGTYSGSTETIDPADADIIWNAEKNRWEIRFNVTGFSGFFVTTLNASLPLQLTSFSGRRENNGNRLNWKTENEINTKEFVVERGTAVNNLLPLGTIQAANRPGSNSYSFTDTQLPLNAKGFYYRLKMTDADGHNTYSNTVWIANPVAGKIIIYPNPVKDLLNIQAPNNTGKVQVTIYNQQGQRIRSMMTDGSVQTTIDVSGIASGSYILELRSNNGSLREVFMKIK